MRSFSIEEFLAIKDRDLQQYIYSICAVNGKSFLEEKKWESGKLSFYLKHRDLKMSRGRSFYPHTSVMEWITIDPEGKVKASHSCNSVYPFFLNRYFTLPGAIQMIIPKPTASFVRKIVEGKINTLEDVLAYKRSYILRRKSLPLKNLFFHCVKNETHILGNITDPENLNEKRMEILKSWADRLRGIWKIKAEELEQIEDIYAKWIETQNKKFAALP